MTYEDLLNETHSYGLKVKEKPLRANKGRIKGAYIAIKKDIPTTIEKACVLAEELGHYHTTTGNILDQTNPRNRKQELTARAWAYHRLVPLTKLIDAYNARISSKHELAEHLNVTEEFLQNALAYYSGKYGISKVIDNYEIYFDPLAVIEIFEEYIF